MKQSARAAIPLPGISVNLFIHQSGKGGFVPLPVRNRQREETLLRSEAGGLTCFGTQHTSKRVSSIFQCAVHAGGFRQVV